jgi:AcrR family transcriptional regulator
MSDELNRIVAGAFRLAAAKPWTDVTLAEIAGEAGLSLADLPKHINGKADIIIAYAKGVNGKVLRSVEADPVEGEQHDRIFDVLMRRFEIIKDDKAALASIYAAPPSAPSERRQLLTAALEGQGWMLTAAGLSSSGLEGDAIRLMLTKVHSDVFKVWLEDDDPGLARTMAALDRKLRDGERYLRMLERPISIGAALYRAFRAMREKPKSSSQDSRADDTAD